MVVSLINRLRAEAAGFNSPFQCFHPNGFQKHKLPNGQGYSCDPQNTHWVDPEIAEREEQAGMLEGVLSKLADSSAPRDAIAVASEALKARIAVLKKEIVSASKTAKASKRFDPKVEAAKEKAAAAKAAYDAACAAVKEAERARADFNHENRLPRAEEMARGKADAWKDAILHSGMSEGDADLRAGYSLRVRHAIRAIDSAEELAITLASLPTAMARKWQAAGEHPHKLTTGETTARAIHEICAGVVARLASAEGK